MEATLGNKLMNFLKSPLLVFTAFLALASGASHAAIITADFTDHVVVSLGGGAVNGVGTDIQILTNDDLPIDDNPGGTSKSVSVWALVNNSAYYNIGTIDVFETSAEIFPGIFVQSQTGVWSDPFGGSGGYQNGLVVPGISVPVDIDFEDFFGPGKRYSSIDPNTLVATEIVLSGYSATGESFDFNSIEVIHPAMVPVPAAVWLFGSGLVGLVAAGRHRKK